MFSKSDKNSPPSPAPSKPVKSATQASTPSIIAADVHLKGNLESQGEVQLDGSVIGDVKCTSLTIGDSGHIKGSIIADTLIIRGSIEGQIRGRSVRLEKSARLKGDLWHESLSVEAGAVIGGQLTHSNDPLNAGLEKKAVAKPTPLHNTNGTATPAKQATV